VKIKTVTANNRKKAFEVSTTSETYLFPYALLRVRPDGANRVADVFPDEELGSEAFTYRLANGQEDTIHVDAVLEYNRDPTYLKDLLLHRLTVEAQRAVESSDLSKRELIRALGTSASQFYRLLDPTNHKKSVGQMLALLHLLGREVDVIVSPSRKLRIPAKPSTQSGGRRPAVPGKPSTRSGAMRPPPSERSDAGRLRRRDLGLRVGSWFAAWKLLSG
jgi:hypothetical protein